MKPRIHVAYCGDYTTRIGPPASMLHLAVALGQRFEVSSSRQLERARKRLLSQPTEGLASEAPALARVARSGALYRLLSELRLLLLISVFNLALYWQLFVRRAHVIITQPFFFTPLPQRLDRLTYIRRGNAPIGTVGSERIVGRWFERAFYQRVRCGLVYLVPQPDEPLPHHVIPNHFDVNPHVVRAGRDRPQFHVVGTWCLRKGGDRVLSCLGRYAATSVVNVHGALGSDRSLNEALNASGLRYHGVTDKPYQFMACGDIFVSFSRLEGLQRSMVEAMLQGCLVLAVNRPDSRHVSVAAGVFCVEWQGDDDDAASARCHQVVQEMLALSPQERERLGMANRQFAMQHFSEQAIVAQWTALLTKEVAAP